MYQTEQVGPSLSCLWWVLLCSGLPGHDCWESRFPPHLCCRELYSQFLREMIIQPGIAKANMGVSREDVTFEDHVSRGQSQVLRLQSREECGLGSGQSPPTDGDAAGLTLLCPSGASFLQLAAQPLKATVSPLLSPGPARSIRLSWDSC